MIETGSNTGGRDWSRYEVLVLTELKRLNEHLSIQSDRLSQLEVKLVAIETKASVIAAVISVLVSLISVVVSIYFNVR